MKKKSQITTLITRFVLMLLLVLSFSVAASLDVEAAKSSSNKTRKATENKLYAAIVIDAQTGEVLMARHADSIRHPASLTKMMTLYMVFEAVKTKKLRMRDRIRISKHATKMPPSKLGLSVGSSILVKDAILSLVTKSANDVSAAIGEKLAGSERNFARNMTRRARDLGMSRTTFRNASGLPDPQQVSTARDMAKLAMALLRDFPEYYHYFGVKSFKYKGSTYSNHNKLLSSYNGLDGIKTGYINASGFNLVASAQRNGRRLIGVVYGGRTSKSRNAHMVKILDEGFVELNRRKRTRVASAPVPIPVPPPGHMRGIVPVSYDSTPITSLIDRIQSSGPVYSVDPAAGTSNSMIDIAKTAPIPVPRPEPIGTAPKNRLTATTPSSAAKTVMQLRVPNTPANQKIARQNPQSWSVQVGAFQSRALTDSALRTAQSHLPSHLRHGQPVIVPQNTNNGLIFRARLQGYNELQAQAACAHLRTCLVVAPGS